MSRFPPVVLFRKGSLLKLVVFYIFGSYLLDSTFGQSVLHAPGEGVSQFL